MFLSAHQHQHQRLRTAGWVNSESLRFEPVVVGETRRSDRPRAFQRRITIDQFDAELFGLAIDHDYSAREVQGYAFTFGLLAPRL